MPKSVAPFLVMATNAMIESNFVLAIENYNNAASAWKRTIVEFDPAAELYFEYMKGSIYLRAGKYEHAFHQFYKCRKFADQSKIPFSNPDRSLPYFGLGEVFYEM
jgi:tetratricopeptide (TPR) repeat protein